MPQSTLSSGLTKLLSCAYPSTGQSIASSCRVRTPSMLSAAAVGGRFHGGATPWRRRRPRSSLALPPASSDCGGESEKAIPLLVERYRDGVAKRYLLDGNSKLQVHWEKHESLLNTVEDENANSLIPRAIRDFVLPAGFPGSVSDDYLEYMLLQFPTNVTGWICYTLVTSSLLKMGIKRWHRSFRASSHWYGYVSHLFRIYRPGGFMNDFFRWAFRNSF